MPASRHPGPRQGGRGRRAATRLGPGVRAAAARPGPARGRPRTDGRSLSVEAEEGGHLADGPSPAGERGHLVVVDRQRWAGHRGAPVPGGASSTSGRDAGADRRSPGAANFRSIRGGVWKNAGRSTLAPERVSVSVWREDPASRRHDREGFGRRDDPQRGHSSLWVARPPSRRPPAGRGQEVRPSALPRAAEPAEGWSCPSTPGLRVLLGDGIVFDAD